MATADQQEFAAVESFARDRGIGILEALAIIRLVLELKDLPQIKELIDKIKDALAD